MTQNKIEVKVDVLNVLTDIVSEWFIDRNLHTLDGKGQLIKLHEEFQELLDAKTEEEEIDAIGDMTVVLIGYALMRGYSFTDCLAHAYLQIKDRTGHINEDGVFVKDTELPLNKDVKSSLDEDTPLKPQGE